MADHVAKVTEDFILMEPGAAGSLSVYMTFRSGWVEAIRKLPGRSWDPVGRRWARVAAGPTGLKPVRVREY